MLMTNRVAPVLLLEDGLLVKTRRFKNPQYVGDPINAVKIFNEKEVDEIVVLDRSASRGKPPRFDLIEEIASEAFMPVAYGGGVRSVDVARRIVSSGIEKVVVTTGWLEGAGLIRDLANVLGSQAVVGGVDYLSGRRRTEVLAHGGSRKTKRTVLEVCRELEAQGAGEILLQSVDRDGTMGGMDVENIAEVGRRAAVPVMAVGGAGTASDIARALGSGASAVGAGSMFVYHGKHRAVLITYPDRAEIAAIMAQAGI